MLKIAELKSRVSATVLNARGVAVATTTALVAAGSMAGAQETGGTVAQINFTAWVTAVQTTAIAVINSAGPALFALMAIIGGVYFVWNRVRSLW